MTASLEAVQRVAREQERAFWRGQRRVEKAATGELATLFDAVVKRAADAVAKGATPEAAAAIGFNADAERKLRRILEARSIAAMDHAAGIVAAAAGKLEAKDLADVRAARILWARERGLERARGLSESSRSRIRRVITRASATAEGPRDVADRVQAHLSGAASRHRAERIARTELHNAATYAQELEAQTQSRALGIKMVRVWMASLDHRTRASHRAANGQTRAEGEPFTLAKPTPAGPIISHLMRPGDPAGPAHEVINCRCALTYVREDQAAVGGPAIAGDLPYPSPPDAAARRVQVPGRRPAARSWDLGDGFAHQGPRAPTGVTEIDDVERYWRALGDDAVARGRRFALPRELREVDRAALRRIASVQRFRLAMDPELRRVPGAVAQWAHPPGFLDGLRSTLTWADYLDYWLLATTEISRPLAHADEERERFFRQ